jgi:hypothetical protein
MSDDVKVTFSADTSQVSRAIQTIGGGGAGGGGGGGRPPLALPPPSGPLGPVGPGGRRRGDWRDGAIDVETVSGGGGGKSRVPKGTPPPLPGSDSFDFSSSFGQAVSALKVVGSFINDSIEYAAKVKLASTRSGESVQSIQRLTNAATTQGISFDAVTNVLTEGNRRLGQGLVSGGSVQLGLNRLGVSMEQIRNKSVKTSEVLMKMADLYKQTGDEVQMANLGVSIFGNSFSELIPLLKEGRTAIMARGNAAGILSSDEINSAALAKAQIERMKKTFENTGVTFAGFGARMLQLYQDRIQFNQYTGIYSGMDKNNSSAMARTYYGRNTLPGETIADFAKSKQRDEMNMIQDLQNKYPEYNTEEGFQKLLKHTDMRNRINMVNALVDLANKENSKTTSMPGFQAGQMAWATSLQAMGGGDVLSAMAQNPQQQIADNTAKSVEVLQSIDLKTGQLVSPKSGPTLEPSVTGAAIP